MLYGASSYKDFRIGSRAPIASASSFYNGDMMTNDNGPDDPVVPLEDLLDSTVDPPPAEPPTSNVLKFPVKFATEEKPKPQIKYKKGDWVRYFGVEGRLSIAQVEYVMMVDPNTVAFITDRGIVPDNMIVEARRAQE